MALKVRLSLSKPLLFNKAAQLVTEIEKSVGCCWGVKALVRHYKARFSTVQHHICLLCVCVSVCESYSVLLDSALGLVKLMLKVPDDLFVFGVALFYHFPLSL